MSSIAKRDWRRIGRGATNGHPHELPPPRRRGPNWIPAFAGMTAGMTGARAMKTIGVGIIGTGWCGGIRAQVCAASPLTESLHLAEIKPERLAEVAKATGAKTAVTDYRELLGTRGIDAVYISVTPETTHYPMARDCLQAGKHVFLEKPIALELWEADDLIAIANKNGLKFTIGYS